MSVGLRPNVHDERQFAPPLSQSLETLAPIDEAVLALEAAKADGARLFQEGSLLEAVAAYERGLRVVEEAPALKDHEGVRRLSLALYCNAAHVLLKAAHMDGAAADKARSMAEGALALEPSCVKALFRRGCAHGLSRSYAPAAEDFRAVLEVEPGNEAARRELEAVLAAGCAGDGTRPPPAGADGGGAGPPPAGASGADGGGADAGAVGADGLAAAEAAKVEGLRLFQEGRHFDAYAAWKRGVDSLEGLGPPELAGKARRLMVALCNNAAQALLRCTDIEGASTERARVMAQRALALDPGNVKALFRRGSAYANARKWALARGDFEQILTVEPGNAAAVRELKKLEQAMSDEAVAELPPQERDPPATARMAKDEADRFRRKLLALADRRGVVETWCQRFNRVQVQASQWAKHQLADPEMSADLAEIWGPAFVAMDSQQKEDFLVAYEFVEEVKQQFGPEIVALESASPSSPEES